MPHFEPHPDTRILAQALLDLAPGHLMTYAEMSALLGYTVRGSDTRLAAARRSVERQDGYVFGTEKKRGVKRLTDAEIAEQGDALAEKLGRTARRADRRIANISDWDRLPEDQKARVQGARALFGAVGEATKPKVLRRLEAACGNTELSIARTFALFAAPAKQEPTP